MDESEKQDMNQESPENQPDAVNNDKETAEQADTSKLEPKQGPIGNTNAGEDANEIDSGEEAGPPSAKRRPKKGFKKPAVKGGQGDSEFLEKIVTIKRVTKVTKGGKKLSFSALAVVGDAKGKVGYSLGKAGEVATAIRKALIKAKRNMIMVPMNGTTITHEIIGQCGGAEVMLKPAADGTGVIAAGPVRAVCDGAGIRNILTKCHRSNNPINVVKATINGFSRLKTSNDE
jgi:small subunit ribosomal protein S5